MTTEGDKVQLQWIKGDNAGTVEVINGQEEQWTKFESGRRIATNLINEFLIPVNGEPLDLSSVPSAPPAPLKERHQIKKNENAIKKQNTPIRMLFDKQTNLDKVDLNITIPLELPKKDIFKLIQSSFENEEVEKEFTEFIMEQVGGDVIEEYTQKAIKEIVLEYFKSI